MKITFDAEKISSLCGEFKDFVPYLDTEIKFPSADSPFGKARIDMGERYLDYITPALPLSAFRRFVADGNRVEYEAVYFSIHKALMNLVLAELSEGKGRFMSKICDILWAITEQTTWVLPAHYRENSGKASVTLPIPIDHEGVCNIDLFSAGTAGLVSMVYYLLKDRPEEQFPYAVKQRIIYELKKRIITPYKQHTDYWWRGYNGLPVNNWCAWITSNVLTTAAIVCEDIRDRRYFLREALYSLNCFLDAYGEDGGCDEGPGYWDAAGACLYDALELVYDMTGGKTAELLEYPLVKNVCDYTRRSHIGGDYRFNCADCHPKEKVGYVYAKYLERMGKRTNNELLRAYGASRNVEEDATDYAKNSNGATCSMSYRAFRNNIVCDCEKTEYKPALYEALQDLQFVAMRSERAENKGIYLGIKGGHNAESHNHNDVGNYVIYTDGKPVIIDIGVGTYTKFTFNEMRYKMHFNFRSEGHNLPVICGLTQREGGEFRTTFFDFDKENMILRMGLEKAYEGSEGVIKAYIRSAKMTDNGVELNDDISLLKNGDAQFIYYTPEKPTLDGNTVRLCANTALEISENDGIEITEIVFDDEKLVNDWSESIWKITVKAHSVDGKITMRSKFYKD